MRKRMTMTITATLFTLLCSAPPFQPNEVCILRAMPVVKDVDRLLLAHIDYESKGIDTAYNVAEEAAGILQIRPIALAEINRILQEWGWEKRYTLDDRFDSIKSVEMWYIMQGYYNPDYDPLLAARQWNSGHQRPMEKTDEYFNEIKKRL